MADLRDAETPSGPGPLGGSEGAEGLLDRIWSFRFTFVALVAFVLLYTATIRLVEDFLQGHYEALVQEAIDVQGFDNPIAWEIQFKVDAYIRNSAWTELGGVEVSPMILARDGVTVIYVAGRPPAPRPAQVPRAQIVAEAERLLPASAILNVTLPNTSPVAISILVFYAFLTLQALWIRSVRIGKKQQLQLDRAQQERDASRERSQSIERELEAMRNQLSRIEPSEPAQVSEVNELREERKSLEARLANLEARELELRESAARASELSQEISALEDLLEEASDDLAARDSEIGELQKNLRRVAKDAASGQEFKQREADVLSKRFATLYPNLEIDDRALQDIVSLRDDGMKLKCEEKLKRLNDEADNLSVRRKVGGLPPHLTIFEMGFAGKGRLYYTKGQTRRFRVLNVGAKNTQNASIEYLRKL